MNLDMLCFRKTWAANVTDNSFETNFINQNTKLRVIALFPTSERVLQIVPRKLVQTISETNAMCLYNLQCMLAVFAMPTTGTNGLTSNSATSYTHIYTAYRPLAFEKLMQVSVSMFVYVGTHAPLEN